jgi:hypothetical protein
VRIVAATALALALAASAAAALPARGTFVPGQSLGGLRLGMTGAQVERVWGRSHGVCRGCANTTWYFTYKRYAPQGAGVELARDRVVALFTLWSPPGWTTTSGLAVGDASSTITSVYGPLESVACANYAALVRPGPGAVSAFYVVGGRLWGFGLARPGIPSCR